MRPAFSGQRHGVWRRTFMVALMGLLGLLLVACAGGKDPFGKDGPGDTQAKGKTPPPVALRSISGMPASQAASFRTILAVSAGQRDIGIVEGDMISGNFALDGLFTATPDSSGIRLGYQWTLRDLKGQVVDQATGEEAVPGASAADPWASVDSTVLQKIADQTAQHIAIKLASMGYATRVSTLIVPPSETFAMAGPGAANDIDYETLNGPGAIDPAGLEDTVPPSGSLHSTPPAEPVQLAAAEESAAPEDAAPAPHAVIRAVAVVPVKGAPGNGNAELTKAMRDTLAAAGWPVLDKPRKDALTITGKVQLDDAASGNQQVKVSWVVSHPEGTTLGDIKQSNAVPAGSLDAGFGDAAVMVAEAAATGIFELIRKYR